MLSLSPHLCCHFVFRLHLVQLHYHYQYHYKSQYQYPDDRMMTSEEVPALTIHTGFSAGLLTVVPTLTGAG